MKTDEQMKKDNPELYRIARKGGTEAPHSSDLLHVDEQGVYHCAVCGSALFASDTKFDSGSGWPSFTDPVNKEAVIFIHDSSHGMRRTEVCCATCKAHLGHVFPDGPKRTGDGERAIGRHNRFCINGISLDLQHD